MNEKQIALRLAQKLDAYHTRAEHKMAAAELRRLHKQNKALLEALKRMVLDGNCLDENYRSLALEQARAAIKAAEGESMIKQSEALFLAAELESPLGMVISSEVDRRAAAELRRLHAQRQALLEALKEMLEVWEEDPAYGAQHVDKARAAIKAAEENT